jgi:hypothetical protein
MVRQGTFGFVAMVSIVTCACTSASNDSPPKLVDQPPLTGDATGFTYELSEKEMAYDCKKLTGIMQVRILQMRGKDGHANISLASRGVRTVNQSVFGASAGDISPEAQYTQDHAMLEAYNRQLAVKNCKTFDIAAELKADAIARRTPAPKETENSKQIKKP